MSQKRQLAAIMFTDIVGYTALMGEDERKALNILEQNREIHKKIIKRYHGKYLKEIGDGTLATFNSSTDAVYCAGKLLQASKELGYQLKVALHEGEVVFDNKDVFGDGVNVAARLEAEAAPGQIFSTASIARNVKNKEGISISFIGEKTFKNVSEPLKVYSITVNPDNTYKPGTNSLSFKKVTAFIIMLAVIGIVIASILFSDTFKTKENLSGTQHSIKTLAVLPVEYISDDPNFQHIAKGLFSEMTSKLTKLSGLVVRPVGTVRSLYTEARSDQENAEALDVSHLLQCSFFTDGQQMRINASLIDVEMNANTWSESYTRDLEEVVLVQNQISSQVADQLGSIITERDQLITNQVPTNNANAYDLYLKGLEVLDFTLEGYTRSIKFFRAALELDPEFSLAKSHLGECYWYLAHFGSSNPEPYWSESWHNLREAIQYDSLNSHAWANLGVVLHNWVWDSVAARVAVEKAIEIDPQNPDAWIHAMHYYMNVGNFEMAENMRVEFNMRRFDWNNDGLAIKFNSGKYRQVINMLENYDLETAHWTTSFIGGAALLKLGMFDLAIIWLENAVKRDPNNISLIPPLIYAYKQDGQLNLADQLMKELQDASKYRHIIHFYYAKLAMINDQVDKAFEYLEKALKNHELFIHRISWYSYFDQLTDDPRMISIRKRSWIPFDMVAILEDLE